MPTRDQLTQFDYLLNAMEAAGQHENPADHGYAQKRQALFRYVRGLENRAAALASPPPDETRDGSVMVRVDPVYVEQMRGDGLAGPFSLITLDESGSEPTLMFTVAQTPTPDSVEWWRAVAQGLGVEVAKLKAQLKETADVSK